MPPALLRTWHARGVALTQGYGLTEASPNVLCLPDDDAPGARRLGRHALPARRRRGRRPGDRRTARRRGRGRAARARALACSPGYFRDPDATAAALGDGWLHTGDLVRRDADGYFTIVDRLKDIYISGGEGVAPAEVEAVLMGHPAVADVAVVGVPDDRWGEAGSAWVVLRPRCDHGCRGARRVRPRLARRLQGAPRRALHRRDPALDGGEGAAPGARRARRAARRARPPTRPPRPTPEEASR